MLTFPRRHRQVSRRAWWQGSDGCPVVVVTREAIEILDRVYFETDEAVILSRSFKLLNDVAAVLQANAYIKRVEIQGHTDDQGSDEYNIELSNRRAEAVRKYLISQGVDGGRLVAKGYGERVPVESGTSDKARAANRRVEFKILEQ